MARVILRADRLRRWETPTAADPDPEPVDAPLVVPAIIQADLSAAEIAELRRIGACPITVVVTLQSVVGSG
jgi:hypothetical protein